MQHPDITLLTGTGGPLGTGHFQRMASLLQEKDAPFSMELVLSQGSHHLAASGTIPVHQKLPETTRLIIRDMRDSSPEEIRLLQKTAPVLALDDHGEGSKLADHTLNMLPHPHATTVRDDLFLYGYSFIQSLGTATSMNRESIAIYLGDEMSSQPAGLFIDELSKLYPVINMGEGPEKNNLMEPARAFLSSQTVITYFGLTMYEALLCGCQVVLINPSNYHSQLADRASLDNVYNCGTWSNFDQERCLAIVHKLMGNKPATVTWEEAREEGLKKRSNFVSFLKTVL